MIDRFLKQLALRGLKVTAGKNPGELLLHGPAEERTPEVMAGLKVFKKELLKRFQPDVVAKPIPVTETKLELKLKQCAVCGRDVTDAEDRERLKDPAHCSRGGGKACRDGNGVEHVAEPRCPYKDKA